MERDLVAAEYVGEYRIRVEFANGKSGVADLKEIVQRGGVFAPLKNLKRFSDFHVHPELHVLTWGQTIDVAPETLYSLATGEPLPAWMEPEEELRETA